MNTCTTYSTAAESFNRGDQCRNSLGKAILYSFSRELGTVLCIIKAERGLGFAASALLAITAVVGALVQNRVDGCNVLRPTVLYYDFTTTLVDCTTHATYAIVRTVSV